ncbi:hypothetical protein DSM112329_00972 [Paraconexibacter sp. AEG42_29]|uniref:2-hydroxychromene-2-carboxylate isomerase n=1 Tax=Paraconexibacter sp. AEG42_29 TaxID=2997339 RepID=A0AAU7ARA7_9ACTN
MSDVTFSFDLGSPYAWLAAERVDALLAPRTVVWEPVLLGAVFGATGRSSWATQGDAPRTTGMAEVERRARERDLPPVVWPDPWPTSYLTAMRVATAVERHGGQAALRTFALAALRAAFTDGADLATADGIALACDRAGLPGATLLIAAGDQATKDALRARTDAAIARGVRGVPTFTVDGAVAAFGDDELDALAA